MEKNNLIANTMPSRDLKKLDLAVMV